MSSKDPNVFLAHARDCLVRVQDYAVEGETFFLRDRKTQDAIYRNLEIVGQSIGAPLPTSAMYSLMLTKV